jgi:DNA-binding Lrp family transcriptional regulator
MAISPGVTPAPQADNRIEKPGPACARCGRRARRADAMQTFFVQIKCELGQTYEVAQRIADQELHSEIYSTAGEFDLLVKYHVDSGIDIGHFVGANLQSVTGIKDTRTVITFKAF